ncbi:MAG: hypothetical protein ACOCXJ_07410 [Planctomycetota bacterium]
MKSCTALLLSVGIGTAAAAEDSQPLVDVAVPDVQGSIERFWQTPLGLVWQDQVMQSIRAEVEAQWAQAREQAQQVGGVDPQAVVDALSSLGGELYDFDPMAQSIGLYAQADLGEMAAQLMSLTDGMPAATIDGADQAVQIAQPGSPTFQLARFGSRLGIAAGGHMQQPGVIATSEDDLTATIRAQALLDRIGEVLTQMGETMPSFPEQPDWSVRMRIIPEGFLEEYSADGQPTRANIALDMDLLRTLPGSAVVAMAAGLDGQRYWEISGTQMLESLGDAQGMDAQQIHDQIDAQLAALGMDFSVQDLITGLHGTVALTINQGVPFPGATLVLPRSDELDQLIGFALQMQFQQQPPAVGQSVQLAIPGAPVMLNVGRNEGVWALSSTPGIVDGILAGTPGGWADSAAAQLALERAGEQPEVVATSDTPQLLTLSIGYLSMAAGFAQGEQATWLQSGIQALQKLSGMVSTGYIVGGPDGDGYRMEARGLLTPVATAALMLPVGALTAVAQQKALSARQTLTIGDGYGTARTLLQAELYPGQVAYKNAAHTDANGNGIGEYGTMDQLMAQNVVQDGYIGDPPSRQGMNLRLWLPNGPAAATHHATGFNADAAGMRERFFVIYAWPADDAGGNTMYAVDQEGTLYQADYWGLEPEWNELFGGAGWNADPVWDTAGP